MTPRLATATMFAVGVCLYLATPAGAITIGQIAPAAATGSSPGVTMVQAGSLSPFYRIPADGTVKRFFVRTGSAHDADDFVRLRIFRPLGFGSFLLAGQSEPLALSGRPTAARVEAPVSLPVKTGDMIGAEYVSDNGGNSPITFTSSNGGDIAYGFGGSPMTVGQVVTRTTEHYFNRLNIEVDFEYTDIFSPEITSFKALYKSFRYNRKGAAISKRAHPGTTISLNLSEPADVTFTVEKGFAGKDVGGACVRPTKKNKRARSCTRWVFVHQFRRQLVTGPNFFSYSARYVSANNGKTGTLRPGPYRMRADAVDAVGNAGSVAPLRFKIRK